MMKQMRDKFMSYAMEMHGKPYGWGGQDDYVVDCSGNVVRAGRKCGLLGEDEDMTSRGLAAAWPEVAEPQRGDLAYYSQRSTKRINHVGIVLQGGPDPIVLEAGLGGSRDRWDERKESYQHYWERQALAGKIVAVRRQSQILARGKKLVKYNRPWIAKETDE